MESPATFLHHGHGDASSVRADVDQSVDQAIGQLTAMEPNEVAQDPAELVGDCVGSGPFAAASLGDVSCAD